MIFPVMTLTAAMSPWRAQAVEREQDQSVVCVESMHEEYAQCIFDYVQRRVDNRAEAEDVTLEVFTEAFRTIRRFRYDSSLKTFLISIARHKCADALRRHQRNKARLVSTTGTGMLGVELSTLPSPEAGPMELIEQQEAIAQMRALIFALPELQREAILLQYADGLTIAEIAVVLKKSVAAVNSLLQRARATLYRTGRIYFAPEENA